MRAILLTSTIWLLAGCGAINPTVTVKVPVPISCQETIPDRPQMPTERFKTQPTLDQFVQAAQAEIERREGYEKRMRTALQACTAPITPEDESAPD